MKFTSKRCFLYLLFQLASNHNIIVPPSWIVKLPGRENFKSSLRKSPRSKKGSTRRSKRLTGGIDKSDQAEKESYTGSGNFRSFVVKPIPMAGSRPIIVFINPKSGGNQGAKLMQKFQWLLNPRQVFDLTQGGPRAGYGILFLFFFLAWAIERTQKKQFKVASIGIHQPHFLFKPFFGFWKWIPEMILTHEWKLTFLCFLSGNFLENEMLAHFLVTRFSRLLNAHLMSRLFVLSLPFQVGNVPQSAQLENIGMRRRRNCWLGPFNSRSDWNQPCASCWRFTAGNGKRLSQSTRMGRGAYNLPFHCISSFERQKNFVQSIIEPVFFFNGVYCGTHNLIGIPKALSHMRQLVIWFRLIPSTHVEHTGSSPTIILCWLSHTLFHTATNTSHPVGKAKTQRIHYIR